MSKSCVNQGPQLELPQNGTLGTLSANEAAAGGEHTFCCFAGHRCWPCDGHTQQSPHTYIYNPVPTYLYNPLHYNRMFFLEYTNQQELLSHTLLLMCKARDRICSQRWICLLSRVAITNNFRKRDKPAVLHNHIGFGNGKEGEIFLIPHDDCLICWKMSTQTDILFIVANVTRFCEEGDSAAWPYYLNCFVANA